MDDNQSRRNVAFNLSLQGNSIKPGIISSRPSSARNNSQSKQPIIPSRGGSAKVPKTNLSTSINISSARERRHSNSSQRSFGITSPPSDDKKSTSSSIFRVSSPPHHHDVDAFFTSGSEQKSFQQKLDDNDEWNETQHWIDELHHGNSSLSPQQQNRYIGSMGMSRDSLNGTVTGTNIFPSKNNQYEQSIPEENNKSIEYESKQITSSKNIQKQANDNRPLSASSTSKQRITPVSSPLLPSSHIDEKIPSVSSTTSSTSTITSKVTLNDVYETLKQLEEVEQFPIQSPLKNDSDYLIEPTTAVSPSFTDEILHENSNQNDLIIETVRSEKSPRYTITHITPSAQSTKLAQSLSIPHIRTSSSINQQTKITTPSKSLMFPIHSKISQENNFQNTNKISHDNTQKLNQLKMNNDERQRQSNIRPTKESEQEFEHYLQTQKDEYEIIIQRHLKFIDQLIEDKKKLSERCERLIYELKIINKKYNEQVQSIENAHQNELEKLKTVNETAEKLRREHWMEEKTKKIKELTVRGLEPEIQNLITKHKNELSKMKTIHQAELLTADERASQRYIRMTEELRDQLEREKEVAIARERELAREKYEKSLHDEEISFSEQRRRLYTEIEEEKTRQTDLITKQRADLDKLRRDIEANHRTTVDTTKREYESIRLEQEQRHTKEIQELKEKLTLDRQNWEENYMKQQETILINKERELREQMKHERDKEIEKIISQFESDTTITKEEAERTAENRVKRIRDKYEAEFHELENSEKQTKEQFNQLRAQMTEIQGNNERFQVLLKQKETEINDIKKITDTLQQEREHLSEIIRQEFADRLILTEEENRRIKGDIAELRARQQLELEKKKEEIQILQQQQDKELETIHEKIKQAITSKDAQVHALRIQYETVVKRAEHLDGLLAQQRKLISMTPSNTSKKTRPP